MNPFCVSCQRLKGCQMAASPWWPQRGCAGDAALAPHTHSAGAPAQLSARSDQLPCK